MTHADGVKIRIARPDDAAAVARIYAPVVRDTAVSFEETPPTPEEMRGRIEATLRRYPWLVAEDDAGVAGYAYAGAHRERPAYRWAADTSVYVDERARGRGIGTALYRELFTLLARLGYLRLFAGIALPNAASEALHRSLGFTEIGTYRGVGFKLGRWHDTRWYGRVLADAETPREPLPFAELLAFEGSARVRRNAQRMRIVYWPLRPAYEAVVMQALQAEPDVELTVVRSLAELGQHLPTAEVLVINDPPLSMAADLRGVLAAATSLRWIHVTNAGQDGLDAAGIPAGVAVTASAGTNAQVLAEHTMAFMLAFVRRTSEFAEATAAHVWATNQRASMTSLEGQTLAIVGLGNAGRALAVLARAFGMRIVAVRHEAIGDALVDDVASLAELHAVLGRADFIALCCASTPETHHLMDRAAFAACKPAAYVVNIARGAVVDQQALAEALAAGTIAGAGLDVADPEPLPPDDPLWSAPNLIISPHCAGSTSPITYQRMGERVTENLAAFRARHLSASR